MKLLFLEIAVIAASLAHGTIRGADSNELRQAILSFPQIDASTYRPDTAATSANLLIAAGAELACASLAASAALEPPAGSAVNENICFLCRLLFKSDGTNEPLRGPGLGGSTDLPWVYMVPPNWPDIPFAIVDGVPLTMSLGRLLAAPPESASSYLQYCRTHGKFRTEKFSIPTQLTASNALQRLFQSQQWKDLKWKDQGPTWHYMLSEDYAKQGLWQQVQNMEKR